MEDKVLALANKTENSSLNVYLPKLVFDLLFDLEQIFLKLKESFLYEGNSYRHFFYRLHLCCKRKICIGGVKFLDMYIEEGTLYGDKLLVVVLSLSDKYLTSEVGINNNFDRFNWLYKFPIEKSDENFLHRKDFDKLIPIIVISDTEILFKDEFTKLVEIIHTQVVLDDSVSFK
jgi:hypothetical protein